MLQTLLILAFLALILYNLGAGLYFMLTDKGRSGRTARSLTWRVALSLLLIVLIAVGIFTGVLEPHATPGTRG